MAEQFHVGYVVDFRHLHQHVSGAKCTDCFGEVFIILLLSSCEISLVSYCDGNTAVIIWKQDAVSFIFCIQLNDIPSFNCLFSCPAGRRKACWQCSLIVCREIWFSTLLLSAISLPWIRGFGCWSVLRWWEQTGHCLASGSVSISPDCCARNAGGLAWCKCWDEKHSFCHGAVLCSPHCHSPVICTHPKVIAQSLSFPAISSVSKSAKTSLFL